MKYDPSHTFITSDHHFGSFKTRIGPWKTFSQEEEETLVEKWNSVVKPEDTVLYAGDFSDYDVVSDLIECRKRLNGNIVLIKGNHDQLPESVYEAVFQGVCNELKIDEQKLVIRHSPGECEDGYRQIFGHLHRGERPLVLAAKDYFCVCVMFHDGFPVSLEAAIAQMMSSEDGSVK